MTMPSSADVAVVTTADDTHSYVDWPAIFAGIAVASALSILMLAFGSAIGLNFTNFTSRPDVAPIWIGIAAAAWLLWVEVSSFMAGGYLTGRLRRRANDATEHEVDVRDGAHGVLVWAGSLILGAVLATAGVGVLAGAVGSAAGTVTNAASNVAGDAADAIDPNAYFVDTLFRPAPAGGAADTAVAPAATETPATTTEAPAATTDTPAVTTNTTPTPPQTVPATPAAPAAASLGVGTGNDEAMRAEAGRIFAANTVNGEFDAEDRSYLAQVVASQTGLSQAEAETRVDEVIANVEAARDEAAQVAETARKTAVIAAFLIAASLLVSAIGAWWAATKGGKHRDEGTVFADAFRRF